MKGKVVMLLFALPFFGVGVWMTYSIGSNLLDARQMQGWVPVEAQLHRAGYETHSGDDSNTYEAFADYSYNFGGTDYFNDRVSIAGGADNIGDHQTSLGNRLSAELGRGENITVFVDADNPADSIIDRDLRWGLLGFKAIFMFVFGGIGLGLLIYLVRGAKEKDLSDGRFAGKPWLANDSWQTALVKSSSKTTMYFTWGFAAVWNLISAPLPFVVYREVTEKENTIALVGLLFPVVGMGLLIWALRRTLEWNRFGAAPVQLDPFPGAIGGHVGGTIDLGLSYDPDTRFEMTLTNLYSYVSGSGDNRSRRESAKWQDSQVAHAAPGGKGSRLSFRFDIPEGLTDSDADPSSSDYFLWRLSLRAAVPGIDLDRDYEIPVYATGMQSQQLSEFSVADARSEQHQIDEEAIRERVNFRFDSSGRAMHYPMGRNLYSGIAGILFGAVFGGAGWLLFERADSVFMGGVFGLIGVAILLSSLYILFNSLEVVQAGADIRSIRRILGIQVKQRHLSRADFVGFSKKSAMQTQSGGKHVMHYSVYALDKSGSRIVVGEGFRGASQADAAIRIIAREFSLTPDTEDRASSDDFDDSNFLLTDN